MTYLYADMLEVHRRWVEATQVWLVIQVFWGTPHGDCSSVCDWTLVLTTHGVVPQCRCRDDGWDIGQTDDEIVGSVTFTRIVKTPCLTEEWGIWSGIAISVRYRPNPLLSPTPFDTPNFKITPRLSVPAPSPGAKILARRCFTDVALHWWSIRVHTLGCCMIFHLNVGVWRRYWWRLSWHDVNKGYNTIWSELCECNEQTHSR